MSPDGTSGGNGPSVAELPKEGGGVDVDVPGSLTQRRASEITLGLAHDLRNTLAALGYTLKGLERGVATDEQMERIRAMEHAMTASFATISKLEGVGRRLRTDAPRTNVVAALHAAAQLASVSRSSFGWRAEIVVRREDSFLRPVVGLPEDVEDAFLVLLLNLRDAIDGPGGRIIVSARAQGQHAVRVSVERALSGSARSDVVPQDEPIFGRTRQGEEPADLDNVRSRLERWGGSIACDAVEGRAFRFDVTLTCLP